MASRRGEWRLEIPNAAPCSAWLSATPSVLPSNLSRTPAAKLGFRGGQLLADLGARVQHRLRQFLDDMKLAELVGNVTKHLGNRLRIQARSVRRDAPQHEFAPLECRVECAEK